MPEQKSMDRFINAQDKVYAAALNEIKNGRKKSHWMWFIFPQIGGLGFSETSKLYAIRDIEEAKEYLQHPVLGKRLIEISNELLKLQTNDAGEVFGYPDNLKLKSSMTLFASVENTHPVFEMVLVKFFKGMKDEKTLHILGKGMS